MPETKWRSYAEPRADGEYLALISYLPLTQMRMLPKFLSHTRAIQAQLNASRGLIGYALLARFLRRRFWTVSVWEDEQALTEFVRHVPHSAVMAALTPHLGRTEFVRWTIPGSAVPPTWDEALRRLQSG